MTFETRSPLRVTTTARRLLSALALATSFTAVACTDTGVSPAPLAPARVAFAANIASRGAATTEVRLTPSYRQVGGGTVLLGSPQLISLTSNSQQVPVSIDLAACLRDANRAGLNNAAAATDECVVSVELQLLLDGAVVDRFVVGPLSLRPGQVATVSDPVPLADIASVQITAPTANTVGAGQPLRLETRSTMALTARILDSQQRIITGRAPIWSSSAPTIATVSASGVVTAVSTGSVRISADVGGKSAGVDVRVVPPPQLLTVASSGLTGSGTVRTQPTGIDCAINGTQATGSCSTNFPGDAQVVITAQPASGTELVAWAGDCTGTQGAACTVLMSQARTVGVVFRAQRALTVQASGTGTGTITTNIGGINCSASAAAVTGSCAALLAEGSILTLTATPTGQSAFRGWSGECVAVTGTTCQVTMSAARTITARFELPVQVTVSGSGLGTGTVTSVPAGISCNIASTNTGACAALFAEGTVVTLTAVATNDGVFRRWSGDCANASGVNCTITASGSSKSATAQFDPPAILTVVPAGSGDGQVIGSSNVACTRSNGSNTGRCSTQLNGATLLLTALPDNFSEFAGWTGACSGTGQCRVTLDESKTVGAVFTRRQVTLTLQLSGSGFGSVSVNGAYTCTLAEGEGSKECQTRVDVNRAVVLTASPGVDQTFAGFGGACVSTSMVTTNSCTFTILAPAVVTAGFGPTYGQIGVTADPLATGSGVISSGGVANAVSSNGLACSMSGASLVSASGCTQTVPAGSSVTLYASASAGSVFAGWGGACASFGSASYCTLTASGTVAVTARFNTEPLATVSVTANPLSTGDGMVVGTATSISCTVIGSSAAVTSGQCSQSVAVGSTVTLVASPNAGSLFIGWGGACASYGSASSCTVTASSATAVTARFDLGATVNVTMNGAKDGVLTAVGTGFAATCTRSYPSTPSAVNAPTNCTWTLPRNQSFTLTITPSSLASSFGLFSGLPGDLCYQASSPCVVSAGISGTKNVMVGLY